MEIGFFWKSWVVWRGGQKVGVWKQQRGSFFPKQKPREMLWIEFFWFMSFQKGPIPGLQPRYFVLASADSMVYLQDVYTVNQDALRFSWRNRLDELGGAFATYVKGFSCILGNQEVEKVCKVIHQKHRHLRPETLIPWNFLRTNSVWMGFLGVMFPWPANT